MMNNNMMSLQRRRERYLIIHMWKILQSLKTAEYDDCRVRRDGLLNSSLYLLKGKDHADCKLQGLKTNVSVCLGW